MSEKGVHDGHRKRMRASFLKRDFNSIPEHEILEILLFYSHPRNDTNGLAHRLIKTFGNLENVLSAPYEELIKVDGIGENAAIVREKVMGYLGYLGIALDKEANSKRGDDCVISTADSKVKVAVVPTNEELAICRETVALV